MWTLEGIWPLYELELITPRLLLRPVRDEDIPGLVNATLAGIHDPDRMPFAFPWTRQAPDEMARGTALNVWRQRAALSAGDWNVSFAVLHEGVVIGRQDVVGRNFAELGTVDTGSWLTRAQQGRGLGKEMRAAVLLWAFDHLGAEYADTAAMAWNQASQGVSRSLGYQPNGKSRMLIAPGEVEDSVKYRLKRSHFRRPDWQLVVNGFEGVAPLLGVGGVAQG